MASTIVIKVQYKDTLRRFNVSVKVNGEMELDMVALKAKILGLFDLPSDADLVLTYGDEDGDIVTLVDDNDLSDAMTQRLKFMRINVILNNRRGAKAYARSSGDIPTVLKSVPDTSVLSKLYSDLVSKAWSSSQVAGEIIDCVSRLGLFRLKHVRALQDPIRKTLDDELLKLYSDLASKASSSSQVADEIVEGVSEFGLSFLKHIHSSEVGSASGRGIGSVPIPTAQEPVAPKGGCQKDLSPKSKAKSSVDKFTSDYNLLGFSFSNQGPYPCSFSAGAPPVSDYRSYAPPPKFRFRPSKESFTDDPLGWFPPKSVSLNYPSCSDKDIYSTDSASSEEDL